MSMKKIEKGKRASISKRIRFEVFARDGFSCRYCGAQSDSEKLVIDHVTAVANGGTNDIENLVTSCEPCNAGKSDKSISKLANTEGHRLALHQELKEQASVLEALKASRDARQAIRQEVCNYYCKAMCKDRMDSKTLTLLCHFMSEHGYEDVFRWIDIASSRVSEKRDSDIAKYISGIRRNEMKRNETNP